MTSATLPGIDLRWGGITPAAGDVFAQFNLYRRKTGESAWTRIATVTSQATGSLTTSGNEITDATRQAGVQGDGRAYPDSSYGLWQAATNLFKNGNADSNTNYCLPNTVTVARATTPAKFGGSSWHFSRATAVAFAYAILLGVAAPTGEGTQGIPAAAGQQYTFSFWDNLPANLTVVSGGSLYAAVTAWDSSGVEITEITDIFCSLLAHDWQRNVWSFTTPANTAYLSVRMVMNNVSGDWYVGGVQLETGGIATPYIDTNGATASRGAARVQAPSSVLSPVQGWFACAFRAEWTAAQQGAAIPFLFELTSAGGESAGRLALAYLPGSGSFLGVRDTSFTGPQVTVVQALAAGTVYTLVFAWTATQLLLSVNGGAFAVVANSITGFGTLNSTFDIGSQLGVAGWADGGVYWAAAGAGTLTNADAATLGAPGATDPTWAQLLALHGGAASPTLLWTADTATYSTPLSYSDYNVASGQSYDYEVTATVLRSGTPIESLAGTASGSVTFAANFLHQVGNPANYLEVKSNDVQTILTPNLTLRPLWGRKRPTGFVGEQLAATFKAVVAESLDTDYSAWNALRTLFEQQRDAGAVFCYRPRFNPERWFVALVDVNPREDFVGSYAMTLDLAEVDFDESV